MARHESIIGHSAPTSSRNQFFDTFQQEDSAMPHITFIHGIANKPARDKLHDIWKHSLERNNGINLGAEGITSSIVY
jgi:hypothetical protein